MATIYNSELTKELKEGGKIQQLTDSIPNQLADKVVPVMEVNPKLLRRINLIKTATSGTIYTTPTDRDFFLCACFLSGTCNSASTTAAPSIQVVPRGGVATTIAELKLYTSALIDVSNGSTFETFVDSPILLERGSNIVLNTVSSSARTGTIFGYIVDNSNA